MGRNKATKFYSVQVPTTTYLKQFIVTRYGNPIKIDNQSLLGVVLIALMQKPKFNSLLKSTEAIYAYKLYNDQLQCVAPLSMIRTYNYSLSVHHAIQINRYFEKLFEESIYIFCARKVNPTNPTTTYADAIFEFAELNNIKIGQDVTFECLKKIEYRYRKSIQKKIVLDLSSQNPNVQSELFV